MANFFQATDEFHVSLKHAEQVGISLSQPSALTSSQLPVTNAVACAMVVLMSGYFESYLKDLIQEYILEINALGKVRSAIPSDMQLLHYSGGAKALEWAAKQDKELAGTTMSMDLANRLASLSNITGYTLAWEAFANTESNPGVQTVAKLMKGLQINGGWSEINDLETQYGSFDVFLKSFMKMRNVCAHTGRHSTPPSGVDIVDYVEKFVALGECIDYLVKCRLTNF